MNGLASLPTRIYGILLRRWVPTLSEEYARAAAATFQALARDAWNSGLGAFLSFGGREIRSLFSTVFAESRARRGEARTARAEARRRTKASTSSGSASLGAEPADSGGRGSSPGSNRPRGDGDPHGTLIGLSRVLDALGLDVRYAVRNLARTPGFTVAAVLSLTFGIAVSTVLFSVANVVFIRPLPHAENPEALVRIFSGADRMSRGPMAFPDFSDLRDATQTLADVAVARDRDFYVGSAAEASRRVWGQQVSENYFDVLGVPMARGRGFLPEDIEAGRDVVVIGHNLWQQRFAGDPGVLGQQLLVDGRPYTVIGVGPQGMVSLEGPLLMEVVIPTTEERDDRGYRAFTGLARLRGGVSLVQVQAELDVFSNHMAEAYPEHWDPSGDSPRGLNALTPHQAMIPDDSTFWLAVAGFLVSVGLILLITCSNVANLLLTRAFRRREEIAVRSAIGAQSRRILAQLLTENLILFGLAGITSLLVIHWLVSLTAVGLSFLPPLGANFDVDGRVASFTFGLTLLAGLTFGLLPAVQASRPDLISGIKGRSAPLRFRRFGIRNLLVGAQVGGSVFFVMVTLLLLQSVSHVRDLELGFDPEQVAVLALNLSHGEYGEEEGRQFLASLEARLEGMTGVEGAEVSTWVPLEGGSTYLGGLEPEGYTPTSEEFVAAGMTVITPGYLDLLKIDHLRGRTLLPEDDGSTEMVALASQAFVDHYWPGESGVGKLVRRGDEASILIVGVVADVPFRSLAEEPSPHLWLPYGQWYDGEVVVHVRTTGDPRALLPALRAQVADLDPDLPVLRVDLMENVTANGTLPQRILSMIMGLTGIVALSLAMLGIYGVVSFSVTQRTREVGLRMALGAEPGRVTRMVVWEGVSVAMVGLVPGFVLSLVAAQLLRTLLFGVDPTNPLVFAGGLGLLGFSVIAASLAPALRASRAHPMDSLRTD